MKKFMLRTTLASSLLLMFGNAAFAEIGSGGTGRSAGLSNATKSHSGTFGGQSRTVGPIANTPKSHGGTFGGSSRTLAPVSSKVIPYRADEVITGGTGRK